MATQAEVAEVAASPATQQRVRVVISRENGYVPEIIGCRLTAYDITGAQLMAVMPREYARMIPLNIQRGYHADGIISRAISRYNVPPEVCVAALTQCVIAWQALQNAGPWEMDVNQHVDEELDRILASQPSLIAIGDKLFTLHAQGVVSGAKGMKLLRKRVMEGAKQAAAQLLANAKIEARAIIENGNRQLAAVRDQIASETRNGQMRLPAWVVDNQLPVQPVRRGDGLNWLIAIDISLKVDQFMMQTPEGDATWYWDSVRVALNPTHIRAWMPINLEDGRFRYNGTSDGIRLYKYDEEGEELPHISSNGCCMELQGLPAECKNMDQLQRIRDIVNRGMKVVNLSSLLRHYKEWHKSIRAQTPPILIPYLNALAGEGM